MASDKTQNRRQADRTSKMVAVTLRPEEREILERHAKDGTPKSRIVGAALRLLDEATEARRDAAIRDASGE